MMHMILNNLDAAVAQFPDELVTYGGTGSVFQNWAQFRLVMQLLSQMTDEQTLVLYSGHPMGLYPSHKDAPRIVVTNGMVVPNYSANSDYERYYMLGVSQYGQMTAGSFCYIGPQGIVHGTAITLMEAGRKYLALDSLRGKVFVTAGLGGMSGAQPKAAVICGAIGVIAEVSKKALRKRHEQGWLTEWSDDLDEIIFCIRKYRNEPPASGGVSIGYLGNVVNLWERLVDEPDLSIELGSDQTSCHLVYGGGYYPVGLSFEDAEVMMAEDPPRFKEMVDASLIRHVTAVNKLCERGMRFWDYGNSFLLSAGRAGADVFKPNSDVFKYPSYVQDIMGDIFSLGFGPFRWVCTSGLETDLEVTDILAAEVMRRHLHACREAAEDGDEQAALAVGCFADNLLWIEDAGSNKLVVGSQARILYANANARIDIALALNAAVAEGRLHAPVVISRDHHDVSGADSPWRETSNITDGSRFLADMAVHNFVGDAFRGATLVALHNGGGTGFGEARTGGFCIVLDGSAEAAKRASMMLHWEVFNGISRRAWDGNKNANLTITSEMKVNEQMNVTRLEEADSELLYSLVPEPLIEVD
jgi:urocanate hydratase